MLPLRAPVRSTLSVSGGYGGSNLGCFLLDVSTVFQNLTNKDTRIGRLHR